MPLALVAFFSFASALATALICARAEPIGRAVQVVSAPDGERRLHQRPTPLVGGLAILVPVYLLSLGFSFFQHVDLGIMALLAAAMLMLIVGFLDDRLAISPVWRLFALSFITFSLLSIVPGFVLHSLKIWLFQHYFDLELDPVAGPFTVLVVMGFVNAANMADGINGQLIGSVLIWSALLMRHETGFNAAPFVFLTCSCLAALPFNLKGRLFSGSAGAYALSTLIGLAAIASYRQTGSQHAELPMFWFWLPVSDCVRLMVARLLERRSPFSADRNHIHHLLLRFLPDWGALGVYLVFLAAPGILAEINNFAANLMLIFCFLCYAGFVWRAGARPAAAWSPLKSQPMDAP